jgi:hypothetical protein
MTLKVWRLMFWKLKLKCHAKPSTMTTYWMAGMSTKDENMQFYEWLFGRRDKPVIFDDKAIVPFPMTYKPEDDEDFWRDRDNDMQNEIINRDPPEPNL